MNNKIAAPELAPAQNVPVAQNVPGTKIVATLGPATRSPAALRALLDAGVDVVRLNFSHGRRSEHEETLRNLRAVAEGRVFPVAVMGDLCGPKIRLGKIAGGSVEISVGDEIRIVTDPIVGDAGQVSLNQPEIIGDIGTGHRVLIDDGAIRLRVVSNGETEVVCRCEIGGTLWDHKGVNLPDSMIGLHAMTEKDIEDVRWAASNGLDYIALSFVRSADDVHALRALLDELGAHCHIVAKVETPQAVADKEAIVAAADVVLVARGDLGVEMDVAQVPRVQKELVDCCREAGKPAIVATQMLQSMISAPTPTRAEVSDVANAIVDGADAVMLSGETAVGKYAVEAIGVLRRVALETEAYDQDRMRRVEVNKGRPGVTAAVVRSMHLIAEELDAKALAVWTEKGVTARLLSKHRADRPIVALTPGEEIRRRMAMYYGVTALSVVRPDDIHARIRAVDAALSAGGWAVAGDLVVVGTSPQSLEHGDTGAVTIHLVEAQSGDAG